MIVHFVAFLGISVVVIVTPGPDTALTVRNSLFGGRRGGVFTAAGVASGQATWALFTAAGIAALLRSSQPAFTAIRIAGVCYLLYLGLHALAGAVWSRQAGGSERSYARRIGAARAFRQGLFSDLSNPKIAVFFISLLPQFSHNASFTTLLLLGMIFCVMTLIWLSGYALLVAKAGDFLRRRHIRRALDALTGVALLGLGLRLALERQ